MFSRVFVAEGKLETGGDWREDNGLPNLYARVEDNGLLSPLTKSSKHPTKYMTLVNSTQLQFTRYDMKHIWLHI